jgi:hypothetical protein
VAAPTFTAHLGTKASQYGLIILGTPGAVLGGGFKGLPGIVV